MTGHARRYLQDAVSDGGSTPPASTIKIETGRKSEKDCGLRNAENHNNLGLFCFPGMVLPPEIETFRRRKMRLFLYLPQFLYLVSDFSPKCKPLFYWGFLFSS